MLGSFERSGCKELFIETLEGQIQRVFALFFSFFPPSADLLNAINGFPITTDPVSLYPEQWYTHILHQRFNFAWEKRAFQGTKWGHLNNSHTIHRWKSSLWHCGVTEQRSNWICGESKDEIMWWTTLMQTHLADSGDTAARLPVGSSCALPSGLLLPPHLCGPERRRWHSVAVPVHPNDAGQHAAGFQGRGLLVHVPTSVHSQGQLQAAQLQMNNQIMGSEGGEVSRWLEHSPRNC